DVFAAAVERGLSGRQRCRHGGLRLGAAQPALSPHRHTQSAPEVPDSDHRPEPPRPEALGLPDLSFGQEPGSQPEYPAQPLRLSGDTPAVDSLTTRAGPDEPAEAVGPESSAAPGAVSPSARAAPTLGACSPSRTVTSISTAEIGRAHVCTPVTFRTRMPSSA